MNKTLTKRSFCGVGGPGIYIHAVGVETGIREIHSKMCDEETLKDSEEIWQLHSSLDVLLLNPELRKGGGDSVFGGIMSDIDEDDEDGDFSMFTLSKPSRRPAVLF
jgi:hypothetical protein